MKRVGLGVDGLIYHPQMAAFILQKHFAAGWGEGLLPKGHDSALEEILSSQGSW